MPTFTVHIVREITEVVEAADEGAAIELVYQKFDRNDGTWTNVYCDPEGDDIDEDYERGLGFANR